MVMVMGLASDADARIGDLTAADIENTNIEYGGRWQRRLGRGGGGRGQRGAEYDELDEPQLSHLRLGVH